MLSLKTSGILALLAAFNTISAASVRDHNAINAFEPHMNQAQQLAFDFRPYLTIIYAAVDEHGNTSGGLNPVRERNSGCSQSALSGQMYSRSHKFAYRTGIVYAWFVPKTQEQRFYWLYVVVWLNQPYSTLKIEGVYTMAKGFRYASDGGFYTYAHSARGLHHHPLIGKGFDSLDAPEQTWFTKIEGKSYKLADWDAMTDAARRSLNNKKKWGGRLPPIADGAFERILADAWPTLADDDMIF